jgi:hypothetical protein
MWQGLEQTRSLEDRLAEEAKRLREQAELLPPGVVREAALQKALADRTGERVAHVCRSATAEVRPPQFGEPLRGGGPEGHLAARHGSLAVPDFPKKSERPLISGNGCRRQ